MEKIKLSDCIKTNDIDFIIMRSDREYNLDYKRPDYELTDYRKNYLIFSAKGKKSIALEVKNSDIVKAVIQYNKRNMKNGYSTQSVDEVKSGIIHLNNKGIY